MKPAKVIIHNDRDRAKARKWIDAAPRGYTIWFKPPTRSNVASARMWALLDDVAAQKDWPLGSGKRWPSDAWKDLFSASLRGQEMVPNLDGNGFVAFGSRTSEFSPEEMSDMITLIEAWGAEHGVEFTDPQPTPSVSRSGARDETADVRAGVSSRGHSGSGE